MEYLQEAVSSKNIFVWLFIVIAFVLFIKFLKAAGKGFLLLVAFVVVVVFVGNAFPEFVAPMVDFVKGGWLGQQEQPDGW